MKTLTKEQINKTYKALENIKAFISKLNIFTTLFIIVVSIQVAAFIALKLQLLP